MDRTYPRPLYLMNQTSSDSPYASRLCGGRLSYYEALTSEGVNVHHNPHPLNPTFRQSVCPRTPSDRNLRLRYLTTDIAVMVRCPTSSSRVSILSDSATYL